MENNSIGTTLFFQLLEDETWQSRILTLLDAPSVAHLVAASKDMVANCKVDGKIVVGGISAMVCSCVL